MVPVEDVVTHPRTIQCNPGVLVVARRTGLQEGPSIEEEDEEGRDATEFEIIFLGSPEKRKKCSHSIHLEEDWNKQI